MDSNFVKISVSLMTDEFQSLETIEDKINYFIYKSNLFQNVCSDLLTKLQNYKQNHKKSLIKSKQYLEEANHHYSQQKYELALNLYSKAIMNIPYPSESGTNELSIAHSLRSNVFYKLKQYGSALFDANCALNLLPTIGMKIRKIDCLVYLDRYSEAKTLLQEVLQENGDKYSNQSQIDRLKQLNERLTDPCFAEKEATIGANKETAADEVTKTFQSNSFRTFVSLEKGRGYYATKDIPKQKVLLREETFVATLDAEKFANHCNECLANVGNQFIACKVCNEVVFCSQRCLNRSSLHQKECTIAGLLRQYGSYTSLVFKMLAGVGVPKVFELLSSDGDQVIDDNNQELDPFVQKYMSFMAFEDHKRHRQKVCEAFDIVIGVKLIVFLHFMQLYQMDTTSHPNKQFISLCLVIVSAIRKVLINYFSITASQGPDGCPLEKVGDMLTIKSTLFNHSCQPNVKWLFENQCLQFSAIRDIVCGEELTITYGQIRGRHSVEERQKSLYDKYYFKCNCPGCLDDAKSVLALQCLECDSGPVLCGDNSDDINWCLNCGKSYEERDETVDKLKDIQQEIDDKLSELEEDDDYTDDISLDETIQLIKSFEDLVYKESNDLFVYQKRTSKLCFLYKRFPEAMDYSLRLADGLKTDGQITIEWCIEMSFYGRSYYEWLRHSKCVDHRQWKACLGLNEKVCNLLKDMRNNHQNMVENQEQPVDQPVNPLFSIIDTTISMKQSIVDRMKTQFTKLGLIYD